MITHDQAAVEHVFAQVSGRFVGVHEHRRIAAADAFQGVPGAPNSGDPPVRSFSGVGPAISPVKEPF